MSAGQSNLSHYGYDVVVALAQVALNESLKSSQGGAKGPLRCVCGFSGQSSAEILTFEQLLEKTNRINPFDIEDGATPETSKAFAALLATGFQFVTLSRVGAYELLRDEMDILSLAGHSTSASFNIFHADFQAGEVVPPTSVGGSATWRRAEQSAETPWYFTARAGVMATASSDPAAWPRAVRERAANYPSCKVSLVGFQLEGAEVVALPGIPGLVNGSPLALGLATTLLPLSAQDVTALGANLIGYWLQPAPVNLAVVTAMDANVTPFLNAWDGGFDGPPPAPVPEPTRQQANAATLNLLCAVDDDAPPAVQPLRWNWLPDTASQSYDGVLAVGAPTYLRALRAQLDPVITRSCWSPRVDMRSLPPTVGVGQGGPPNVTTTVDVPGLRYAWSDSAEDSSGGDTPATVRLDVSYVGIVSLVPKGGQNYAFPAIGVNQTVWMNLTTTVGDNSATTPIVSLARFQVIALAVDENGRIAIQKDLCIDELSTNSEPYNPVQTFGLNYFWLEQTLGQFPFEGVTSALAPPAIDPEVVCDFFFPFGKAFSFADVDFSGTGDLFGHVTFLA